MQVVSCFPLCARRVSGVHSQDRQTDMRCSSSLPVREDSLQGYDNSKISLSSPTHVKTYKKGNSYLTEKKKMEGRGGRDDNEVD